MTITTIITAVTGAATAIIAALRNIDRKKGKTTCRVTGQPLKPRKTRKSKEAQTKQSNQ